MDFKGGVGGRLCRALSLDPERFIRLQDITFTPRLKVYVEPLFSRVPNCNTELRLNHGCDPYAPVFGRLDPILSRT
jgi:hypothetical protein